MNLPQLQKKKPKWHILCRIRRNNSTQDEKGFSLSFTADDFNHFVPPNGNVTDFNLHAELGFQYPKLKTGIYINQLACCLITKTSDGIYLHGVSSDLQKLREVISKILSSAGMRPTTSHAEGVPPMQQLLTDWSEAILSLKKK